MELDLLGQELQKSRELNSCNLKTDSMLLIRGQQPLLETQQDRLQLMVQDGSTLLKSSGFLIVPLTGKSNTSFCFLFFLRFLSFLLQLIYSILSITAIQQSDPGLHIDTFFFSHYPPSCSTTSDWIQFPVLYSKTSLLIHSKCNSLHLLSPKCSPSHSLPFPLGNHRSVLHRSVCLFSADRFVYAVFLFIYVSALGIADVVEQPSLTCFPSLNLLSIITNSSISFSVSSIQPKFSYQTLSISTPPL